jgi:hypothetical protein
MEKSQPDAWENRHVRLAPRSGGCSFCLLVLSLKDPSETDLSVFLYHLIRNHGLKIGEPKA